MTGAEWGTLIAALVAFLTAVSAHLNNAGHTSRIMNLTARVSGLERENAATRHPSAIETPPDVSSATDPSEIA